MVLTAAALIGLGVAASAPWWPAAASMSRAPRGRESPARIPPPFVTETIAGAGAGAGAGVGADSRGERSAVPPAHPHPVTDVLDLLGAAVGSGADVPRALRVVGEIVGGPTGDALAHAAVALVWGSDWDTAWAAAPAAVRRAVAGLESAWTSGSAAAPVLRAAADGERRRRRRAGRDAAARLGVRLVLPLGLCFLPAFVLLGLVPVVISLAGRAWGG